MDIIKNSINKPYIRLSSKVYKAIFDLKNFNYENIYNKSLSVEKKEYYKKGMRNIYNYYLRCIEDNDKDSIIYKLFLNNQSDDYLKNNSNKRLVIDFIAGMTDDFFREEIKRIGDIS